MLARLIVFALKLGGYVLTNSVAILSDALESVVNVAAALLAFALRVSAMPADENHPYGHTKSEYVSGFLEGLLIGVAGVLIVQASVSRLMRPRAPDANALGLGLTVLARVVNLGVGLRLLRAGRENRSVALEADGQHLRSDVWSTAAVLLGVLLAIFTGWAWLDPLIGLLVALGVPWLGWNVVRRALAGLLDESLPPHRVAAVTTAIKRFRGEFIEYHDLRTRRAGPRTFVDFHLILPRDLPLQAAHDLCDRVEDAIDRELPGGSVIIHVEPEEFAHGKGAHGAGGGRAAVAAQPGPPPLS